MKMNLFPAQRNVCECRHTRARTHAYAGNESGFKCFCEFDDFRVTAFAPWSTLFFFFFSFILCLPRRRGLQFAVFPRSHGYVYFGVGPSGNRRAFFFNPLARPQTHRTRHIYTLDSRVWTSSRGCMYKVTRASVWRINDTGCRKTILAALADLDLYFFFSVYTEFSCVCFTFFLYYLLVLFFMRVVESIVEFCELINSQQLSDFMMIYAFARWTLR